MQNELLVALNNPYSRASEQYRRIRTNIEFSGVDQKLKVINITSSLSNESKTTIACNLAFMYSNKMSRVLLIDADLRNPSIYRTLGLKTGIGLTDLVLDYSRNDFDLDKLDISKYITIVNDENLVNPIYVLNVGSRVNNPAEFIGSNTFRAIIDALASQFDMVLIDSAPSGFIVDGVITSTIADGTIFIMEYGRNKFEATKATIDTLKKSGVNILGGIISKAPVRNGFFSRYYDDAYYYKQNAEGNQSE